MAEEIIVPAEAAHQLVIESSKQISRHREAGKKATARSIEKNVADVRESLDGKDGEFVSLDSSTLSSIIGQVGEQDGWTIEELPRELLEHYDV